jgi:hypothetical protein
MLAKHKVGSSTLLTRSIFSPWFLGAFSFLTARGLINLNERFHLGCTFLDLIFDQTTVIIGLFDVLRVVLPASLCCLTGNEAVYGSMLGFVSVVKGIKDFCAQSAFAPSMLKKCPRRP